MSGYIKKGNQWYLNGQRVNTGDQGYDRYGNLNEMQSDGTWRTVQRSTKEGKEARKNGLFTPEQYKKWKPKAPETAGGQVVKWLADLFGSNIGNNRSDLIGTAGYLTPGVGNALSAIDAVEDIGRGDYKSAAINTIFALPFIGNIGRYAKIGLTAAKLNKAAKLVDRGTKVIEKVSPVANRGLTVKMMTELPSTAKDLHEGYLSIKEYKQLNDKLDQARKLGASEEYIKEYVGDAYDTLQLIRQRDNSFTGNIGSLWDLLGQDN